MDNSQVGSIPTESLLENNDNYSNIEQFLSDEIIIVSQELVSLTMANMIPTQSPRLPNLQEHNNIIRIQHARRGRQQYQQQQQRQQELQWQQRETRQLRRQRQRQRRQQLQWERQQGQRPQEQQQQRQRQRREHQLQEQRQYYERPTFQERQENIFLVNAEQLLPEDFDELRHHYPELFDDSSLDEIFNEIQLEIYNLETEDPKERWEQEQINEIERTATYEQQQLNIDYIEQLNQIAAMELSQERYIQQRNAYELLRLEQWDQLQLYHQ